MDYTRFGHSGLEVSRLCLGCMSYGVPERGSHPWSLGETEARPFIRRALELGINFFDSANVYSDGTSEEIVGRALKDFAPRDEIVLATKVHGRMRKGPNGAGLSRKAILSEIDHSLRRLGTDYVDLYQIHRFDPDTPLEETMGALETAVRQGKALYVGISSYSPGKTREAVAILRQMGVPLLIHQPSYSMLNRWVEAELLDTLCAAGVGCIAFSPLAQGLLTDKYLAGIPADARINRPGGGSLRPEHLSAANLARVRGLDAIARARGQSLAQMAVAWVLRRPEVTSALIGASRPEQIRELVAATERLAFTPEELRAIDEHAVDGEINLWLKPSTDQRP
jgi:L-glyceraldehyde 3-phosphate reductase